MKLQNKIFCIILILLKKYFFCCVGIASTLNSISIQNYVDHATVVVKCSDIPVYMIFSLHNPERAVIDLAKISKIHKNAFPIDFSDKNLIKCVRTSVVAKKSARIVLDLNYQSIIKTIVQKKIKKNYHITLVMSKKIIHAPKLSKNTISAIRYQRELISNKNQLINNNCEFAEYFQSNQKRKINQLKKLPIIVAIDAGHGGQDPGATRNHKIYEKNINLRIAEKLKKLLDLDPIFKAIMIREGDYFLSVMERSNVARKEKANILISIHTDSAINPNIKGASVWVLSSRRAKAETTHWLKSKEKHSELLGGLGDILINNNYNDPYFNHLVLDLQFIHSQKVGYNIAVQILRELKNVKILHKHTPEYSSFGVLRSPDIPSILVETGFISNFEEACLLVTNRYQEKIAQALYKGLRSYFMGNKCILLNSL